MDSGEGLGGMQMRTVLWFVTDGFLDDPQALADACCVSRMARTKFVIVHESQLGQPLTSLARLDLALSRPARLSVARCFAEHRR